MIDLKNGNPLAASIRIGHCDMQKLSGQRRHDLRIGAQPGYVDVDRLEDNSVLIEPARPFVMRDICQERRARRDMKRAMKRNASVATVGIITFGSEAAQLFEELSREAQHLAFADLTRAAADRLNTTVHGLVVHRDEATIHAHFQLAAFDQDGQPLAKTTRPAVLSELQDLAAEVMAHHCPGIERGRKYGERIAAGADFADVVHKSVRELHRDLPRDLEVKRANLAKLAEDESQAQERVDEMQGRVGKLMAKAELSDKETKRLAIYEKRLNDRVAELTAAQEAAEAAKAEAARLADIACQDAERIVSRVDAVRNAVTALSEEVAAGTIRRTEKGSVKAKAPERLKPGFPEIGPAVEAAADYGVVAALARAEIAEDRQEADMGMSAVVAREERFRRVVGQLMRLLDRVGQRLGLPVASTLSQSFMQLKAELEKPVLDSARSSSQKPVEPSTSRRSGLDSGPGL